MIKSEGKDLQTGRPSFGRFLLTAIKGTIAAYILLIVCFALLAAVYTYTPVPDRCIKPAVNVITCASLIFGGCVSGKNVFGFGWLHGAATGFFYTAIRIAASYVVFDKYIISADVVPLILVAISVATLGGIIGINIWPDKI